MHLASLFTLIALPLSLAKNISISVGQEGLVFNPEVVHADVGDLLQFHFYPRNHSVAQSSFSSPCKPSTGGVYSGFMPVTAQGVHPKSSCADTFHDFETNCNAGKGLPGHCEQHRCHLFLLRSNHALPKWNVYGCQSPVSLVFPTTFGKPVLKTIRLTGDVLAAYKDAAKNTSTVAPPAIEGGVLIDATGNSTSTSSTTSTSSSSSTASSTSTSSTTSSTSSTAPSKGGAAGNTITQCDILGWIGVSGLVLAFMMWFKSRSEHFV